MSCELRGKVYLVGAGPGDYRLITLKGMECLKKADTIIYDDLVNPRLLDFSREGAELISVNKLGSLHSRGYLSRQNNINALLVKKAREGRMVCRLKNGDPLLFGRGGEEGEYLAGHAIGYEIVPGVTAALAAAAYAAIPLTDRRFASTLCLVTGHEDLRKEASAIDFAALTGIGTVVFYMAVENIAVIAGKLINNGKDVSTAAAVVENASLFNQRIIRGRLDNIAAKARIAKIRPPALVIVGKVVDLRKNDSWFEQKPLFKKRILVTRPQKQAAALSVMLEELGAEAREFPVIEIKPLENKNIDRVIKNIREYDWLVFTSVNAVEILMDKITDLRCLAGVKIAAIGEMTADYLKRLRLCPDIVPKKFCGEGLIREFKKLGINNKKILLPRSKQAGDILPRGLRGLGAEVREVFLYETRPAKGRRQDLRKQLQARAFDCITFTSSSAAENFAAMFRPAELKHWLSKVKIAAIGPITKTTLDKLGLKTQIMPRRYTIKDMVKAIAGYFQ